MRSVGAIALFLFVLVLAVTQNPGLIDRVQDTFSPDEEVVIHVPATGRNVNDGASVRSVPKSELTIADLKLHALNLINEDRRIHGVEPVFMGTNNAAQSHAEDMLAGTYLGHWWMDGRKPYMVYSELGGDSYVSENAARSGFSQREYAEHCNQIRVRCEEVDPYDAIQNLQHLMVYDDASSDWGHRDNIVNPGHRKVNIGVAYSDHFLALVQHFEGGSVTAVMSPSIEDGLLRVTARINEPDIRLHDAAVVHWEPLPQQRSTDSIEELESYCVGGDFSEECGEPVAVILPPAPAGQHYTGLDPDYVVADHWLATSNRIEIEADLGELAEAPGMYTVTLLRDTGSTFSAEPLLQLTVPVE